MPLYATEAELTAIHRLEGRARIFLSLTACFAGVGVGQFVGILLFGSYSWRVSAFLLSMLVSSVSYWRRLIARRAVRRIVGCIENRSRQLFD